MLRSSLVTAATSGLLAIVAFLNSVVMARALGVEGRGLFASVIAITTIAGAAGQFGLGQAYVVEARRSGVRARARLASSALLVTAGGSVCGCILAVVLASEFDLVTAIWTVVYSGATALMAFASGASQTQLGLTRFNGLRLGMPVTALLLTLLVWHFSSMNAVRLVAIQSGVAIALSVITLVAVGKDPTRVLGSSVLPASFSRYMRLGLGFQGTIMVGVLINNIDKIYMMLSAGLDEFGLYSAAFGLSRIVSLAQTSVGTAVFSKFAGIDSDQSALTGATERAFRLTFAPMLLCALLLAAASPWLIPLALGASFQGAAIPFAILVVEGVVSGASWVIAQQFNALGQPRLVLMRQAVSAAPLLVLIWLIPSTDESAWLACLLLFSGLLRLVVSISIFNRATGLALQRCWPTRADVAWLRSRFD